jgi:hypothetical protein
MLFREAENGLCGVLAQCARQVCLRHGKRLLRGQQRLQRAKELNYMCMD